MKIYNILRSSDTPSSIDSKIEFIEERFSFYAFIFQGFWFFYHKLWLHGITILTIEGALSAALNCGLINNIAFFSIELPFMLLVALQANSWYIENMVKNKHLFIDIIIAKNLDEAKLKFYQTHGDLNNV